MEEFILPEKWFVYFESEEKFKVIVEYFNNNSKGWIYRDDEIHSKAGLDYKQNYYGQTKDLSEFKLNKMSHLTIITFEQFEKYVLNKPDVNIQPKEDLELNQIIIKLLS